MNRMPYAEARKLVSHAVACIDCHDPATMQLRVTRPGFIEGMRALKASQGEQDYDVNRHATRQEMRAFVCGQCHVEYYFKGPEKRLTYPWAGGLRVENILAYYDAAGFSDWTHGDSGAPVLKAQHPEFEMWNQGIHARSGVTCADCHMPYMREGALKISDHHVRSPLLNINRACQTCHKWPEDELRNRVVRAAGAHLPPAQPRHGRRRGPHRRHEGGARGRAVRMPSSRSGVWRLQRHAQFRLDFVEAENSTGFHAPEEAARILGEAIDFARQGQVLLRDPTFAPQHGRAAWANPRRPVTHARRLTGLERRPTLQAGRAGGRPRGESILARSSTHDVRVSPNGYVRVAAVGDLHFGKNSQGSSSRC